MPAADSEHFAIILAVLFLLRVVCVSRRILYVVKALAQVRANLFTDIETTVTQKGNVGSVSPNYALGGTGSGSLEVISRSIRFDQFLKLRIFAYRQEALARMRISSLDAKEGVL